MKEKMTNEQSMTEGNGYDANADFYHQGAQHIQQDLLPVLSEQLTKLTTVRYELRQSQDISKAQQRVLQKSMKVGKRFAGRALSARAGLQNLSSMLIALAEDISSKRVKHHSIKSRVLSIRDEVAKTQDGDVAIEKDVATYGPADSVFSEAIKQE